MPKSNIEFSPTCTDPTCSVTGCQLKIFLKNMEDVRNSSDYLERREAMIKDFRSTGCQCNVDEIK